jgi:tetratricopeptide (TPR) repeat protein
MPDADQRYWAFLSYSHADRRWAQWLHAALEGYVVPRRLVGRETPAGPVPRRLRPIFRDREELGAGANLGDRLIGALKASTYLIVICSPAAARSTWVGEEIRQFKLLYGEDRVLAVIAAGEPFASDHPDTADQECFPKALRTRLTEDGRIEGGRVEPLAADLRPGKDGRQRALLKLLAGMLQIDLDEIVQRDAQRRHQQLTALAAAGFAGAAVLGGLAVSAINERNEALVQRAQAEGLIEFMIGDLRKTLEPAGRLDAMDAIGTRALNYYAAEDSRGLDATSLGRRARVLQVLGTVREQRGDLPAAMRFFEESSKSTAELLAREPDDPQRIFDHAQSVAYIGEVAHERGDDGVALQEFQAYRALADRLVTIDPKNQNWWAEVDEANTDLGVVLLGDGRSDEAAADFARALSISQTLAQGAPASRDRQWDLSQIYAWVADAEVARGHLDAAIADRTAEGAIYDRLIERSPSDTQAAVALAASRAALAKIRLDMGRSSEAIADLRASVADVDRLMTGAPDNTYYKQVAGPIFLALGQALLQAGRLGDAAEIAGRMLDLSEAQSHAAQSRKDPGIGWQGVRLGEARVLSLKIAAAAARSRADQMAALMPASAEAQRLTALAQAHPTNVGLARTAAEAALLAGDGESLAGRPSQALAWWRMADAGLRSVPPPDLPPQDHAQILLRQLAFRLRLFHPPAGALSSQPTVKDSGRPAGPRDMINYKW